MMDLHHGSHTCLDHSFGIKRDELKFDRLSIIEVGLFWFTRVDQLFTLLESA